MVNHFISMWDLEAEEIYRLVIMTDEIKNGYVEVDGVLDGYILGMIFEKPSTRTRVSFEAAMIQLGGSAMYLPASTLQLSRGESIKDTAKVLSRYVDILMARVYRHETLVELAEHSDIPVINGLSDKEHPVQILSDLYTIYEYFNRLKGVKIAFVGDGGNNVAYSLAVAAAKLGLELWVASPSKYWPPSDELEKITALALTNGGLVKYTEDPVEAVKDANVVYTDTFVSMGMEEEKEIRLKDFLPRYQVNSELMENAAKDSVFMHCLPAHRGVEVTDEVIDADYSIVYDQAENRLHMQKTLILYLLDII